MKIKTVELKNQWKVTDQPWPRWMNLGIWKVGGQVPLLEQDCSGLWCGRLRKVVGSWGLLPLKVCSQRSVVGLRSLLVSRISMWGEELDTEQGSVRTAGTHFLLCLSLSPLLTSDSFQNMEAAALPSPPNSCTTSLWTSSNWETWGRDSGKCSFSYNPVDSAALQHRARRKEHGRGRKQCFLLPPRLCVSVLVTLCALDRWTLIIDLRMRHIF